MRVLELFSGIGGMHAAMMEAEVKAGEIVAYDTSLICNKTYELNFIHSPAPLNRCAVRAKLVEQLEVEDLEGFDLWTMSPPCQPYSTTKAANQRDDLDPRSQGLHHIIKLLLDVKNPPKWILLENVKGFHGSKMQNKFLGAIEQRGFSWRQFLLNPIQVGIPNNRLRYDMLLRATCDDWHYKGDLFTDVPETSDQRAEAMNGESSKEERSVRRLREFLDEELGPDDPQELVTPASILEKPWARGLSYVGQHDTTTFCFTGSYGKVYHKSSGSMLYMHADHALAEVALDKEDMTRHIGRIRLFSPREILNLMGFPKGFKFPEGLTLRHKYKLVGNSINVTVVALLFKFLIPPSKDEQ
ncbi:hypothetical protein GUITHDRAFT_107597 [Guillardia theta CCMP2712]|uniref:tRNA (cytosine(38)-C(5))-methyltransferase n=1 Tax=Guillardia theta (strain CCMP2712) TaxID=905079 RepID=L1JE34_GUITC|nr:hypothetical protein GUITHDRAFT_107597 [Guillardia theta CCMP2712]EKX46394.1 hypothetical protein GUITHDRAFT_107597 [Guillardia theta CCMP2712]|eukprot:XP_005833374.1 hypothetical protein GUITHDRAFT_107597 [Guillardia theta CCMP2712]